MRNPENTVCGISPFAARSWAPHRVRGDTVRFGSEVVYATDIPRCDAEVWSFRTMDTEPRNDSGGRAYKKNIRKEELSTLAVQQFLKKDRDFFEAEQLLRNAATVGPEETGHVQVVRPAAPLDRERLAFQRIGPFAQR